MIRYGRDMEQPHFVPPFAPVTDPFAAIDARGTTRCRVRTRAHLRGDGQGRFDIDLIEVSPTGFRAETTFALSPGTAVWLTLPGLAPLEAVVMWRDPTRYGCEFSRPLDAVVFDHLVALGGG
ncbi:pilus assembly protein PilZ [Sphingomonas sp. Leaf339]|uniref:pilus assembly protein PilZ n=1 Tax=Sphingomonas sp. Leaf339 TaxID=1736343 RepID=UPI000A7491B3|nr:pilus assembly protein PilZ [Sphingomonas sp. Leaf339]